MNVSKQRGVALVITLIMLSVITVMAVAFLALSRRERASVVHSRASVDAELMASTGLERVKAEILSATTLYTNVSGAVVYSNALGPDFFVSHVASPYPPFTNASDAQLITGQTLDPIAPVFIHFNRNNLPTNGSEFRFFLDLNRNGQFEATGTNLPIIDVNGVQVTDAQGADVFGSFV